MLTETKKRLEPMTVLGVVHLFSLTETYEIMSKEILISETCYV